MNIQSRILVVALSLATINSACMLQAENGTDGEPVGESIGAFVSINGTDLNGTDLNGTDLNGTDLNGTDLNGTDLNGTVLVGTDLNGTVLSGTDFVGATMPGVRRDGTSVTLRIDDITPSTDPEIYLYTVSYFDGSTWENICGSQNGNPNHAVPLEGTWDYTAGTSTGGDYIPDSKTITFACLGSVLAKCTLLGYKPWKTVEECQGVSCQSISMRHLHQTCTRMMRADYCGDGYAHTTNGVAIDLWDNFDIQTEVQVPNTWLQDAEWSPEGATCVENFRHDPNGVTSSYVADHCPSLKTSSPLCFSSRSSFSSRSGYHMPIGQRSLLRNEFGP